MMTGERMGLSPTHKKPTSSDSLIKTESVGYISIHVPTKAFLPGEVTNGIYFSYRAYLLFSNRYLNTTISSFAIYVIQAMLSRFFHEGTGPLDDQYSQKWTAGREHICFSSYMMDQ
jgi:hypothetical protein